MYDRNFGAKNRFLLFAFVMSISVSATARTAPNQLSGISMDVLVKFLVTDYDRSNGRRYQGLSSYPVLGLDQRLLILVSKSMPQLLNQYFRFSLEESRDGYELIDVSGVCDPSTLDLRCRAGSGRENCGGQLWVRKDGRDSTNYLELSHALMPLDSKMAQSNGLVTNDSHRSETSQNQ